MDAGIADGEAWPNLFLVGPGRSGTTTLYNLLRGRGTGIYFPLLKEPGYCSYGLEAYRLLHGLKERSSGDGKPAAPFDESCIEFIRRGLPLNRMALNRDEYLSLYRGAGGARIRGDASTGYFFNPASRKLIREVAPCAKILVTLRDPVEWAFSEYLNGILKQEMGIVDRKTFRQYIDAHLGDLPWHWTSWDASGYSGHLRGWLDAFGRRGVRVVLFEEFVEDQQDAVAGILEWLGLGRAAAPSGPRHDNRSVLLRRLPALSACRSYVGRMAAARFRARGGRGGLCGRPHRRHRVTPFLAGLARRLLFRPGKPEMESRDRALLRDLFRDDVREISEILGRKMPWKNFA